MSLLQRSSMPKLGLKCESENIVPPRPFAPFPIYCDDNGDDEPSTFESDRAIIFPRANKSVTCLEMLLYLKLVVFRRSRE